jgi:hypothetical protein
MAALDDRRPMAGKPSEQRLHKPRKSMGSELGASGRDVSQVQFPTRDTMQMSFFQQQLARYDIWHGVDI